MLFRRARIFHTWISKGILFQLSSFWIALDTMGVALNPLPIRHSHIGDARWKRANYHWWPVNQLIMWKRACDLSAQSITPLVLWSFTPHWNFAPSKHPSGRWQVWITPLQMTRNLPTPLERCAILFIWSWAQRTNTSLNKAVWCDYKERLDNW